MKFSLAVVVAFAATNGLALPHVRGYLSRVGDVPQRRELVDVWEREPSYEAELEELDFGARQLERKPSRHEYREAEDQANLRRMDLGMLFGDFTALWGM